MRANCKPCTVICEPNITCVWCHAQSQTKFACSFVFFQFTTSQFANYQPPDVSALGTGTRTVATAFVNWLRREWHCMHTVFFLFTVYFIFGVLTHTVLVITMTSKLHSRLTDSPESAWLVELDEQLPNCTFWRFSGGQSSAISSIHVHGMC